MDLLTHTQTPLAPRMAGQAERVEISWWGLDRSGQ
jgi:hypothetical protein